MKKMKNTLLLSLLFLITNSYALTNQQIFTMQTQNSVLTNQDNTYQHTANQPSTGRDTPNSEQYQIRTPQGQVVSEFQTNNPRAAASARQSYCNRSDSGFNSYETCMAAQESQSQQQSYKAVQYKAVQYPVQRYPNRYAK